MTTGTSNIDEFTVIRSDNRDVERTQLNKILRRLSDRTKAGGGIIDGGFANSVYTPGPAVLDAGAAT